MEIRKLRLVSTVILIFMITHVMFMQMEFEVLI